MSNEEIQIDDILTNDLTGVSSDTPLIPPNEYDCSITKVEQATSERTGNKMLNIQLRTLNPVTAVSGETLGTVPLFARITITPTEKRTKEAIHRDLKRFMLSCGTQAGALAPLDQWVGKNCRVRVGFSKKTEEYPDDRNEVKGFVAQ